MTGDNEKFPWGEWVDRQIRVIALDWHSRFLRDGSIDDASKDIDPTDVGLYAFEGCHDASPSGAILYIGQAGHSSGGTLSSRLGESLKSIWRKCTDGKMRLHSDVWSVWVRWAVVKEEIRAVEQMLITAHSPAFNAKDVRKQLSPEYQNLVVMNAGQKGRLMPVVFGAYLNDDFWHDSSA